MEKLRRLERKQRIKRALTFTPVAFMLLLLLIVLIARTGKAETPIWTKATIQGATEYRADKVAILCIDGECRAFVEPKEVCIPGRQQPILINSHRTVGIVVGMCTRLRLYTPARHVIGLTDSAGIIARIIRGENLTLVYPKFGGGVETFMAPTLGLAKLIEGEAIKPLKRESKHKERPA